MPFAAVIVVISYYSASSAAAGYSIRVKSAALPRPKFQSILMLGYQPTIRPSRKFGQELFLNVRRYFSDVNLKFTGIVVSWLKLMVGQGCATGANQ